MRITLACTGVVRPQLMSAVSPDSSIIITSLRRRPDLANRLNGSSITTYTIPFELLHLEQDQTYDHSVAYQCCTPTTSNQACFLPFDSEDNQHADGSARTSTTETLMPAYIADGPFQSISTVCYVGDSSRSIPCPCCST